MQHRKGHSTLHHPGDMHTHTQIYKNRYCNTHMHAFRHTMTCILTIWIAYASKLISWQSAREVLVIRRGITGLILSHDCRLLPLKFPPPQMKVAVDVEEGMQVFQLLNSSKLFDLPSSNCKSQVADSPIYEPLALHLSSHVCSFVA